MPIETEYLGYAAGILTTVAFFPQAYRMIRTRQTRDISLAWVAATTAGVFLWLCYGFLKQSIPMISANGITFLLLLIILVLKIRYRTHPDTPQHKQNEQRNQQSTRP
ncbi:MAG TPA: SemiSWEET transporter [Chlorobaculum sp.]|nr:SemiSWEET transporter [Chlorobaculum sp.]